jgi:hypothetical protein
MRRVRIAVMAGLLLSSLAWGAPCVTGDPTTYFLLGSTGCTITTPFGVVTVNNFSFIVSVTGGLNPGTILTRLALSPFSVLDRVGFYAYETDGSGNQANLSVAAGQSLVITIGYDLSAASPEVILRYAPGAIAGKSGDALMSVKKETTTPVSTVNYC